MKIPFPSRKRSRGFTLIELLVVIAILAALAGVAYTVFLRSQDKSDRAQCMTNFNELKHLGSQYAQDHYGILPCSGMDDDETTENYDEAMGWWVAIAPYVLTAYEQQPPSISVLPSLPATFRCPADRNTKRYSRSDYVEATPETISYTSWTDNSQDPENPSSSIQTSRGQLLAGIPWLSDGIAMETKSIRNDADFQEYVLPSAERHSDYICVLYADGSIKQIEEPTFKKVAVSLQNKD